jgi:tetratricopeptide (TPR) repeat protein
MLQFIKSYLLIGFFLLINLPCAQTPDMDPTSEPLKGIILEGIDLTLNNRFEQAIHVYQQFIDSFPHYPAGYFYKGATIQAEMLDAENFDNATEFYALMRKTLSAVDSMRDSHPSGHSGGEKNDAWLLFYEGSAFLYRSFLKMKEGDWYTAYQDAKRGVKSLEKTLERDSTLYDAYLGIGSYRYWKSAKSKFLLWLPFIADQRKQGIELVTLAINKGWFIGIVGKDQLVWILMNQGDYQKALSLARENYYHYPESRFLRWTLASAAFYAKEWELSQKLYGELLHEIRKLPDNNGFNVVECLVRLAEISRENKHWDEAFDLADAALRLNLEPDIRDRAKNKLKKALEIREEVEDQRNKAQISN